MDQRHLQAEVLQLLRDSPLESRDVIDDIRESVGAGEVGIAFDTLCSWIYEDARPISRPYYERLAALASELRSVGIIGRLAELVQEDD
jgi:hypothetical protein